MSSTGTFNSFSTTSPTSFLESNTLVSKLAFMLLVLFGFIVLLRIGITIVTKIFKPTESPHLIDGMVDASQMIVFEQDPSGGQIKPFIGR